ncbi:MAG: hypothetical protein ACL7BU_00335 [Candidatus Phlomobacter fragariae]
MDVLFAVSAASFLSILMKISSSYMYFRLGNVLIKSVMVVLVIIIPATVLTSYLVSYFSQWQGYQQQVELAINILIVVAIIYSLFLFIHRIFFSFSLNQFEKNNTIDVMSLLLPAISAGVVLGATGVRRCCCIATIVALFKIIYQRSDWHLDFCNNYFVRFISGCIYTGWAYSYCSCIYPMIYGH